MVIVYTSLFSFQFFLSFLLFVLFYFMTKLNVETFPMWHSKINVFSTYDVIIKGFAFGFLECREKSRIYHVTLHN